MSRNRLRLPAAVAPEPSRDAFVMVPTSQLPTACTEELARQQALYAWALAEAQAVVAPSLLERDLLGVWN